MIPATSLQEQKAERLQRLAESIEQDQALLNGYQGTLGRSSDPREWARCRQEIERLRTSIVHLRQEQRELLDRTSGGVKAPGEGLRSEAGPVNPFRDRGRIEEASRFFDRQRIVEELRQMLTAGKSVSLVGEAEIGKSSLLYYLFLTRAEWLPQAAVIYLDLQGILDEADFCAEVLDALGRTPGDLRALRRALRQGQTVLLLDEAEKLATPSFSSRLHDLLCSLVQEPSLTLVVTSHRPLVEVFPPHNSASPLHNIFAEKRLGPFAPTQAQAFLESRLRGSGVTLTAAEIKQLAVGSGGHPAQLQRLAEALFEEKTR